MEMIGEKNTMWLAMFEGAFNIEVFDHTVHTDDNHLVFHSGEELENTMGMEGMTVEEAVERGAEPCSKCYPKMAAFHDNYMEDYIDP